MHVRTIKRQQQQQQQQERAHIRIMKQGKFYKTAESLDPILGDTIFKREAIIMHRMKGFTALRITTGSSSGFYFTSSGFRTKTKLSFQLFHYSKGFNLGNWCFLTMWKKILRGLFKKIKKRFLCNFVPFFSPWRGRIGKLRNEQFLMWLRPSTIVRFMAFSSLSIELSLHTHFSSPKYTFQLFLFKRTHNRGSLQWSFWSCKLG